MAPVGTAIFDIIGTCFSLEKPRQQLIEMGAPAQALELWFAQTLRDAFALSHAGGYCSLKQVLEAELPRTLKLLGVEANAKQQAQAIAAFSQLELQPDALEAFQKLSQAGWQLIALTNGSEESTHKLLEQSGSLEYFANVFSCDAIQKTKPHPEVYALPHQEILGDAWMIAAHAWDIAGAARAGYKTAFITQQEGDYLSVYPKPDVIANSLLSAVDQMVQPVSA
uniref:HAD family hydrolase n=1 Tax=Trichocoleus desertorum TaxID=1481672 RepID=UPI0025B5B8F2|nr:HAD family hydrolase [Trichocoleus desertorum]